MEIHVECEYECDRQWLELAKIKGQEKVRYCDKCEQCVFWCDTENAVNFHASQKHCLASHTEILKQAGLAPGFVGTFLGGFSVPYLYEVKTGRVAFDDYDDV